ncbi:hypothetical protein MMYC01_207610 [Madurella mycetomatis]|uniref:Uncharacterized protein n=1 Tax=Madurella mycetomatis TaxID=100816 RepID=A0A175VZP7_9PEZI|nr:hypothetical protein MMYC01_207610 [Madurella mycetomatis]
MFLHAGASLHGHEYSSRPSASTVQATQNLRAPLLRSAFAPPKQRAVTIDSAAAPFLRQRSVSDYIPREPSPIVRFRVPQDGDDLPPTPATQEEPVSESELSDAALSIDGAITTRPAQRRRRHRAQRTSTTYCLGYPAPRIIGKTKVVQKVFLPRLLLQLQRVSEDGRLQPVLEVFPASRIAGPVVAPRLAKRFPAILGVKRHLGYDDIVLVRRDDHDLAGGGTESDNEESLERRNLLAVYSPLKHSDDAEIVLDDGSVWVAKPLANGSYDFIYTDSEGNTTTARWAKRHTVTISPTSAYPDASHPSAAPSHLRYTFSIINPLARRHPVMATLTPSILSVQDTYTSVSPSHNRHPPITRPIRSLSMTSSSPSLTSSTPSSPSKPPSLSTAADCESDSAIGILSVPGRDPTNYRTSHQIDNTTKMLITVTALWVALRSGWSQSYTPPRNNSSNSSSDHSFESTPAASTSATALYPPRANRSRRNTWTTRSRSSSTSEHWYGADSQSTTAIESSRLALGKRHSMPTQPRPHPQQLSMDKDREIETPTPTASRTSTPVSGVSTSMTRPRRATSTGAAFMQRHLREVSSTLSAPEGTAAGGADARLDASSPTPSSRPLSLPVQMPMPIVAPEPEAASASAFVSHAKPVSAATGLAPEKDRIMDRDRNGSKGCEAVTSLSSRQVALACLEGESHRGTDGEGPKGPGAVTVKTDGVAMKKNGARSRLSRWIHKLGSLSSSSSSSSPR